MRANERSSSSKKGKGRGWRGDKMGHAIAGRVGGMTTAETHDSTFYASIGRLGGLKRSKKNLVLKQVQDDTTKL